MINNYIPFHRSCLSQNAFHPVYRGTSSVFCSSPLASPLILCMPVLSLFVSFCACQCCLYSFHSVHASAVFIRLILCMPVLSLFVSFCVCQCCLSQAGTKIIAAEHIFELCLVHFSYHCWRAHLCSSLVEQFVIIQYISSYDLQVPFMK